MQYKQISLFCSFPDPAKKKKGLVKVQVLHLFLWITWNILFKYVRWTKVIDQICLSDYVSCVIEKN